MDTKSKLTTVSGTGKISEREKEVLVLAADGYSHKEIADRLCVSEDTIDTHSRSIITKLGARNMKQAIAVGIRTGIID